MILRRRPTRPLAVVTTLLALVCAPRVRAGVNAWTSGGPAGGPFVRALRVDPVTPTTLYAGTQGGGVFRSDDGGASWTAVNAGLGDLDVFALAVDPVVPGIVYAGTTGGGVFQTLDGGGSWTPINTGLTTPSILALEIDPFDRTVIYAGTDGGGVFKTTTGGAGWSAVNDGLDATTVNALAIDPSNPAVIYAATTGAAIRKSEDGGASWQATGTMASSVAWAVAIDPQSPSTVYAGTLLGGIFKSTSGGILWAPANDGLSANTVRSIAVDPGQPSRLYAATPTDGVFASLNGGAGWTPFNDGLGDLNALVVRIDPQMPTLLHAATLGGGVFDYEQNACEDGGQPVQCGGCEICNPAIGCIGDRWAGCRVPLELRKAVLHINDKAPDARDRIVWKWNRGQATDIADYGDPLITTQYEVCIFDESGAAPATILHAIVEPGGDCNGKNCWKAVADRRFKYRNGEAVPDGVTKLLLNEGEDEKAKIVLKGKGDLLALPNLPLPLPFTLQLRNDLGECWEALYTPAGVVRNDDAQFVGKSGL